jgi:ATP-binding cassette subfamily B (MDR/TAP) protein 1
MSLEPVLQAQFNKAASQCLSTGVRGAFVEGCSYGVASALIYLAEALLFYVGAVLIAKGTYTYLQMCQVLNLVVFTVSIGSQLMSFTQKIAKSVLATHDLHELIKLDTNSSESQGILHPRIEGDLVFKDVSFSYPTNPDVSVLNKMSMRIADGECVAIVGTSGCGKSTVASLLQRLYEPTSGTISVGLSELRATDVNYLRDHVAVVSQTPNLFDASIRENIAYGRVGEDNGMSDADVERAARAANVHEFVMSLPQGYDTLIGENASLVSGGQAQRLQVARALGRPAKILILDECTSALDPANQTAVLETIRAAKVGRTTIMVTHKVPVMKMCDRILVVEDGQVREQGTYESLMESKGLFARLANGGEWVSE